jgi:hypothetical protein
MIKEWTKVRDLRALVHVPDAQHPLPGLVLVDGSGEGACDDWGGWPERLAELGVVVLTHDKPGCGGSPGDWTTQSIEDRARETLAAVDVLRAHPAVAGRPVGVFGGSQGGWVCLQAAATEPSKVDYVVTLSGPGVGPAVQERARIEYDVRTERENEAETAEAMAWIDERTRRLQGGEPIESVLADQEKLADRPWYEPATRYFDNPVMLAYAQRLLNYEPVPAIEKVRCPVLAVFGADDTMIPVAPSVAAFINHLPSLPGNPHGIAVFPGANHGLFIADPDPAVDRTDQLAPGFMAMVGAFIKARQ